LKLEVQVHDPLPALLQFLIPPNVSQGWHGVLQRFPYKPLLHTLQLALAALSNPILQLHKPFVLLLQVASTPPIGSQAVSHVVPQSIPANPLLHTLQLELAVTLKLVLH